MYYIQEGEGKDKREAFPWQVLVYEKQKPVILSPDVPEI